MKKIMLATAGVLTAAVVAACGGGVAGSGGHSKAWQDGYDSGFKMVQASRFVGDEHCDLASFGEKDAAEWKQGCVEGIRNGLAQRPPDPTLPR